MIQRTALLAPYTILCRIAVLPVPSESAVCNGSDPTNHNLVRGGAYGRGIEKKH